MFLNALFIGTKMYTSIVIGAMSHADNATAQLIFNALSVNLHTMCIRENALMFAQPQPICTILLSESVGTVRGVVPLVLQHQSALSALEVSIY